MKTYGKTYKLTDGTGDIFFWVSQATTKDEYRPSYANRIHVKNGIAMATDGRRMHFDKVPTMKTKENPEPVQAVEDGDYTIMQAKKTRVIIAKMEGDFTPFPNCLNLVERFKAVPLNGTMEFYLDRRDFSVSVCKMINRFGIGLNFDFLKPLITGQSWKVEFRDKKTALFFESGNRIAAIMLLHMEDY